MFKSAAARSAARTALIYALIATLWIITSDGLVQVAFAGDNSVRAGIESIKGLLFVLVTALVVFFTLRHELQKREYMATQLEYQASVLQTVTDAVIAVDLDFRVKTWNSGAEHIYGWRADEVIGKVLGDVLKPEYVYETRQEVLDAFQKDGRWNGEVIHYCRDQKPLHILASVVMMKDDAGRPSSFATVNHDITERVKTHRSLEETAELLNTVIASSPLAIIQVDPEWCVQLWNPAAETLYLLSSSDVVGKPLSTIPANRQDELALFRNTILSGKTITDFETQRQRGDGTLIDVSISAAPLHNQSGVEIGALMMVTDISRRKRLEAEVAETEKLYIALEQERKLQTIRTRFMRMLSHEFRTPLTIIHSSYDLLNSYFDRMTPDQRQQRLDHIAEQIIHLRGLLDELSVLLHTDPSLPDYTPVELDMVAFCHDQISEIRRSVADTHKLEFTTVVEIAQISADSKLMRHVVNNLVFNAVKYSPLASTITVSMATTQDRLLIAVQDEGIGIPAKDLDHIYDPFFRASNVEAIPGSGLGLAIVKQIIDLHGGTINVQSGVGTGTTMTVSLSLIAPPVALAGKPSDTTPTA